MFTPTYRILLTKACFPPDIPRAIQELEFDKAGALNLGQALAGVEAAPVDTQGRCRRTQSLGGQQSQNQFLKHDGYNFICLGTQLISIIDVLKKFLPPHLWYGADVDAVGEHAMNLNNVQLNPIGVDKDFIQYCSGITQFIWGVFLCIDSTVSDQNIQKIEVETEDAAFRSIACEGVLLEIRTFDTSYFAIYSNQAELLDKISKKFKNAPLDFHTPANNNLVVRDKKNEE